MQRFIMEAGPLIFPLALLGWVILLLALWNGVALVVRKKSQAGRRRQSIDSILFWGGLAAVLGFLGQWIGIGRMARFVADRGIVNPQAVVYGISESLLTTVAGMIVLVVAAFLWFALRVGLWRQEGRS